MSNELKKVEEIYRFLKSWEDSYPAEPTDAEVESLKNQLNELATSSKFEIQKLSALESHFRKGLHAKELFNLIVPFERALHKSLRDDEFLVSEKDGNPQTQSYPLYLILENLRSAFNVGAFFRLGEALGVTEIFLVGYTATPENEKLKKTTMGTEKWLKWQHASSCQQVIEKLKNQGVRIIAVETSQNAIPIEKPFQTKPTAFIFGNERYGLNLETLKLADEVRQISLSGNKNSLNVATCGAICAHEWIRQWKKNT